MRCLSGSGCFLSNPSSTSAYVRTLAIWFTNGSSSLTGSKPIVLFGQLTNKFRKQNQNKELRGIPCGYHLRSLLGDQIAKGRRMPNFVSSAGLRSNRPARAREGPCPTCNQPVVCAAAEEDFDSQGFENHQMDCGFCQTPLDGIVDPFDNALLLTVRGRSSGSSLASKRRISVTRNTWTAEPS